MDDGDRTAREYRPAMQAAAKAREQVLAAAVQAREARRPPATPQEIALPIVNAVSYLVDAVIEQQAHLDRLEKLALANAAATAGMGKVLDGNDEFNGKLIDAIEMLAR